MAESQDLDQLLSSIGIQDVQVPTSYFLFETLALELLSTVTRAQHRRFEAHKHVEHLILDAWLPDGVDDLPGPAAVEIKMNAPFSLRTLDTLARVSLLTKRLDGHTLLLIAGTRVTESENERVKQWMTLNAPDIHFKVWDIQVIRQRITENSEALKPALARLPSIAVRNLVTRSAQATPSEWKQERKRHIESARNAYTNGDLVLVLGAGVSASAGVPDWNTMLSRLLVAMIENNLPPRLNTTDTERLAIANRLREVQDSSPLLEARYIRAGLQNSFEKEVSSALYHGLDDKKTKRSSLLASLARLCAPRRSGARIKSVVNYNFDNLLESHLDDRGIQYRAIFNDGEFADKEELSIYHVHGFLPRDKADLDRSNSSKIILSEERYHSLMVDPYSWANLVQLSAFRESTCLLVGLSLTDPNLRRLLEISANSHNSPKHFAVLRRLSPESFIPRRSRKVRKEVVKAFSYTHHNLQQASLKELGINIIWVEDHKEVASIIDEVSGSAKKL